MFIFLCYLLFFLLSLGQISRLSLPNLPINFYPYELVVYFFTALLLIKYRLTPYRKLLSFEKAGIAFFVWMFFSFIISVPYYNLSANTIAFLYLIRLLLYFIFFVYFKYYLGLHVGLNSKINYGIVIFNIFTIIFSLLQYFYYSDIGNVAYLGWDPHRNRLVGLFFDPPMMYSVFILLSIYFVYICIHEKSKKTRTFYIFIAIVNTILSIFTYSRGGYLAVLITLLFLFRKKFNLRIIGLFIIIALLFVFLYPRNRLESTNLYRTTSIISRINDYKIASEIWRKSPIVGIGYNHIRFEKDRFEKEPITESFNPSHASSSFHSSHMMILVTTGLLGFILWINWGSKILKVNKFSQFAIPFLSIISFSDNVILHPMIFVLFLVLLSLSIALESNLLFGK